MKLEDAINYIAGSRKAYNKNSGERLSFGSMFELMEDEVDSCGEDKDYDAIEAINKFVAKELAKFEAQLFKQLAERVDESKADAVYKDFTGTAA